MPDYILLSDQCKSINKLSATVVDDFLVYYAAERDNTGSEFDTRLSRFRQVIKGMPGQWTGLIKAQYIGHRIFRQNGLIHKYLRHAAVKSLNSEEQKFLQVMADHPWRFSFSIITANPAADFYEMEDVFSGETFLLYSRSIGQTLDEQPIIMWFNLIGNNGSCWQTYGPVIGFTSFEPDDIFFFATELNKDIESEESLLNDIEANPIPYMMLASGSNYPLIRHGDHEVIQTFSENLVNIPDLAVLRAANFQVEYAGGVFKLSHPIWSEPPFFAEAYWEEEKERLIVSALNDQGYLELAKLLRAAGVGIPVEPDIRIHLPMLMVIEKLLKRKVELNPYATRFEKTPTPEASRHLDKINEVFSLALPAINAGEEPDIDQLAKQVGLDPEEIRELIQAAMQRAKDLRK